MATKGLSLRWLAQCMALAKSSFPVPLSPWMRMGLGVAAISSAKRLSCTKGSDTPMRSPKV